MFDVECRLFDTISECQAYIGTVVSADCQYIFGTRLEPVIIIQVVIEISPLVQDVADVKPDLPFFLHDLLGNLQVDQWPGVLPDIRNGFVPYKEYPAADLVE